MTTFTPDVVDACVGPAACSRPGSRRSPPARARRPSRQKAGTQMACQPDWPLDTSCLPGWDPDPQKWTPEQQRGARLAGEMMWRLTAGRFGFCDELVRPASRGCYEYWHYQGGGALRPVLEGG